jgi:hypothetical protein
MKTIALACTVVGFALAFAAADGAATGPATLVVDRDGSSNRPVTPEVADSSPVAPV